MSTALVLFAHGARDPEWARPFRDIAGRVTARRSDLAVKLAFLEFQSPSLAEAIGECIGQGHRRIAIAPLFMAQGGHLKNDVPRLLDELQQRYPDVTLHLMPAVGDVEALRAAMADWLVHHTPAL